VSIPGTFSESEQDKLDKEIQEELKEWQSLGIFLEGITASNESIIMLKIQMQTVFNMLLEHTEVTEDVLNVMFKTVMRDTLRELRSKFTPEVERRRIASITGKDPNAPVEVPELRLLGPDGKPMRF
jgi:hypothetical protein